MQVWLGVWGQSVFASFFEKEDATLVVILKGSKRFIYLVPSLHL